MPYNGSGVYVPPSSPGAFNPAVSGQNATPSSWNTLLADISTALSTALCTDGQSTVTQNLPMAAHKFTGLAAGTAATDSVNLGQIQSNTSNYAADTGAADAYVITLSPSILAYTVGQTFKVKIAHTNLTTTPTLAVDGLTAGTIVNPDGTAVAIGSIVAGEVMSVVVSAVSTGTPTFQLGTVNALLKSANLSDVASASQSRINLNTIAVVKVQVFSATGTYTPSTGMINCIIECVGGGGGSGGLPAITVNRNVGSAGGGAGGYSKLLATAATIGASQTVTIGAAGAAGSAGANPGGDGGDTSVGTLCIGKGGKGGINGTDIANNVAVGGAGGVAGTGTITIPGAPGGSAGSNGGTGAGAIPSGAGGSGPFGSGGAARITATSAAGQAATGFGAGASGAASYGSAGTTAGAAGTAGYVVITEYCNQ